LGLEKAGKEKKSYMRLIKNQGTWMWCKSGKSRGSDVMCKPENDEAAPECPQWCLEYKE